MATKTKKAKRKDLALTEGGGADTPAADFSTDGPVAPFAGVDVKDVPEAEYPEDEHILLTGESWVVLGEADGVPDWAVGSPAAVLSAPVSHAYDEDTGDLLYDYTDEDAIITVRERSQGITLSVPLSSCTKVSVHGGRGAVVNFP